MEDTKIRMRFGKPTRVEIKELFGSAKRLVFSDGYGAFGTFGEFRVFKATNVEMTKFRQKMNKNKIEFDYESPVKDVHIYRIKPKFCKRNVDVVDNVLKMYKPFVLKNEDTNDYITVVFKWSLNGRSFSRQAQIHHTYIKREFEKPINSMVLRLRGERSVELMKNPTKKPDYEKAIKIANNYFKNLILNRESKQTESWQQN